MSGESMDTSEKTYGGCEGPDAMYVKLISSDGNFSKLIHYLCLVHVIWIACGMTNLVFNFCFDFSF